jgi:ankyrin repeat protein
MSAAFSICSLNSMGSDRKAAAMFHGAGSWCCRREVRGKTMSTTADVMKAIQIDDIASLKQIVDQNPDLASAKDENGNSPLLIAAYYGRVAIVQAILDRGVRPNIFEACAAGLTSTVELMLKENPKVVSERSHDGWTPLHLAAFFGRLELVRLLLDAGASMLAKSTNNESNLPINAAAAGRRTDVVRLLVARGCPPDARASDVGYTPLHLAANNGNAELVEFLLQSGADRSLKTGSGETAHDLAIKQGHVIPLLKDEGAAQL